MSRSSLFGYLRAGVGLLLAFLMIRWVIVSSGIDLAQVYRTIDRRFFLAAMLVHGTGIMSAAYRWYLMLTHIGVHLPLSTVGRLTFIGIFSNLFVPGGVGGDLIKMVYLRRESGDRFPQALLTVLLDRVLGLAGLLALALLAVGLNRPLLASASAEMKMVLGVVVLASLLGLLCGLIFLGWPLLSRWSGQLSGRVGERVPAKARAVLVKVSEALHLLRSAPGKLLGLVLLSVYGHLSAAVGVYLVALGIGAKPYLNFSECLLATQLSNLVAAVPLTPGGLGGRDMVMALFFRAADAPPAIAGGIPTVISAMLICWSMMGGLALLWEKAALASVVPEPAGMSQESTKIDG